MFRAFLKKYRHANWAVADQAMVSGVNFLTGILLARFLGIEEFGVFTLVWMVVLFVNSIQMAMISAPMMSIGPKQSPEDEGVYYGAVVTQQLIFSLVTFVILLSCLSITTALWTEWGLQGLALPLAIAGFFFQNQDFLRRYFFCRQRAAEAFWNDVISYLGQLALLCLLFFKFEIDISAVLLAIGGTSAAAVFFGVTKIETKLTGLSDLKRITKRHWVFSKWSTLSAVFQWASGNLVFMIAGGLMGAASVGILKAAQNIMGISHILFQAMENFVPSKASLLYKKAGVHLLRQYRNKVIAIGGGVTLTLAVIISIFSNDLFALVYGERYDAYSYVLEWYALIYMFMFMGFPLRAALRAIEDVKSIFFSQVVAGVFVMIVTYPMIIYFELMGALMSLLLGYAVAMFFLYFYFCQRVNIMEA